MLGKTRFNHFGPLVVIILATTAVLCAVRVDDFVKIWSLIATQPPAEPESGLLLGIGLIGLRRFLAAQWTAEKKNIAS